MSDEYIGMEPAREDMRDQAMRGGDTPTSGQLAIDVTYKAWLLLGTTQKITPHPGLFRSARSWLLTAIEEFRPHGTRSEGGAPGADALARQWTRHLIQTMTGPSTGEDVPAHVRSAITTEVRTLIERISVRGDVALVYAGQPGGVVSVP